MIHIRNAINDYDDTVSGDTGQSPNNLIMVVDEVIGVNDFDAELAVGEEEAGLEGDDETTQHHSPSTPSDRPLGVRSRLAAMLFETGLELEAKDTKAAKDLPRILGLLSARSDQILSQAVEGHRILS